MLSLIDSAIAGAIPFLLVKLVTFSEFAHSAPVFPTVKELKEKLAVEIPSEHTERLIEKAREHDIFIQTGSFIEFDPKYPDHVFNSHQMLAHLRTEVYPVYRNRLYPPKIDGAENEPTYERDNEPIEAAKKNL